MCFQLVIRRKPSLGVPGAIVKKLNLIFSYYQRGITRPLVVMLSDDVNTVFVTCFRFNYVGLYIVMITKTIKTVSKVSFHLC